MQNYCDSIQEEEETNRVHPQQVLLAHFKELSGLSVWLYSTCRGKLQRNGNVKQKHLGPKP